MRLRLKKWLWLGEMPEDGDTRLTRRLFWLGLALFVAVLITGITAYTFFAQVRSLLVFLWLFLVGLAFMLPLFRSNRRRGASIVLTAILWLGQTMAVALIGIRGHIFGGYLFILLMAGFLVGFKTMLLLGGLSVLVGVGLGVLEAYGIWVPPGEMISSIPLTTFTQILFLLLNTLVGATAIYYFLDERQRAKKELQERRRAQQSLEESQQALRNNEERLTAVTNNLPGVVYQFYARPDGKAGVYYVSSQANLYFELPSNPEYWFENFTGHVHPDDHRFFMDSINRAVRDFTVWDYEGRYIKESGEMIWFKGISTPVKVDNEIRFNGILLDVTARRRAEEELVKSEKKYRAILDSIQDVYFRIDEDDTLVMISPSGVYSLGYERAEDILGKKIDDFWAHTEQRQAMVVEMRAAGALQDYEVNYKTKQGEIRVASMNIHRLFNDDGSPAGTEGIWRDITARKEAENEIRRLNASLEQRVNERTAQLSEANRELEAFAYSVSHDLRAPLRTIDGFCRILEEDYGKQMDEPFTQTLARVRAGANKMSSLIDDLLRLSRLNQANMYIASVNLSEMVRNILADLSATAPGRQVEVIVAPDVIVRADAALIQVALSNLLENAWKFSSKHARARIEFGVGESEGRPFYFVRDDGAGFNMAYINKLFGVFQRLHGQNEFSGSGIGLATVQRIVRRHGGKIWAEGIPEEGATFFFTLAAL